MLIVIPEPVTVAHSIAEKILALLDDDTRANLTPEYLLQQVPELKNVDGLLTAVEKACNDFGQVERGLVSWTDSNALATSSGLEKAFRDVVGKGSRVYEDIEEFDDEDDDDVDDLNPDQDLIPDEGPAADEEEGTIAHPAEV